MFWSFFPFIYNRSSKWIISFISHHFNPYGRYELNKLTSLPMCGFIAQLVEEHTGNAEVTGSNPVEALIFFFRLLLSNCLNWKIHCDDHSSLSLIYVVSLIFGMFIFWPSFSTLKRAYQQRLRRCKKTAIKGKRNKQKQTNKLYRNRGFTLNICYKMMST